jgi:hypothetical protein
LKRQLLLLPLALGLGCFATARGSILVDKKDFYFKTCRSGERHGYYGIELESSGGGRLRVLTEMSFMYHDMEYRGPATVGLFSPGEGLGEDLGVCALLDVDRQAATSRGFVRLHGSIDLNCVGHGHTVIGRMDFENCY